MMLNAGLFNWKVVVYGVSVLNAGLFSKCRFIWFQIQVIGLIDYVVKYRFYISYAVFSVLNAGLFSFV